MPWNLDSVSNACLMRDEHLLIPACMDAAQGIWNLGEVSAANHWTSRLGGGVAAEENMQIIIVSLATQKFYKFHDAEHEDILTHELVTALKKIQSTSCNKVTEVYIAT